MIQKLFKLPAKFLQSPPVTLDQLPIEEEFEDNELEKETFIRWFDQGFENLIEEKENS